MLKNVLILFAISVHLNISAKRFHIVGSFANKTTSSTITIGNNTVKIVNDSFEIYGYTDKGDFAFMHTNNSYQWGLWLTFGEYKIIVEEWKNEAKNQEKYYFKINNITGPPEANQFFELEDYKATLIKKAYNKQLADESVNYLYTKKIWEYIKIKNSNDLITYCLANLPSDKYSADLLKKADALQKANSNTKIKNGFYLLTKGNKLENFSMKNANDSLFQFYSIKAKYILLDFWGSWCGPCRLKHPYYVNLYKKYKAKGFEIVSVALDDDKQRWLNAIQNDKLAWTQIGELKTWNNSLALKYSVNKVPFNVLLNANFEIITTDASIGVIEAFLKELP